MMPLRPCSTLFPYTTLFRSHVAQVHHPEHEQHHAHLGRQGLEDAPGVLDGAVPAEVQGDEPEVHEVERSEEHTSELQSLRHVVCRRLLEKKKPLRLSSTDTT